MDIRNYFTRKRTASEATGAGTSAEASQADLEGASQSGAEPPQAKKKLSSREQRAAYRSKLSYKKAWEEKYPWVSCDNPLDVMFCVSHVKSGVIVQPALGVHGQHGA